MNVAIIPARGGSKRIKNKNIRLFDGKPLIAYSLNAAVQSGLFTDILVSTDSVEIAETAERFGATVIVDRPSELSDDYTGTMPVVKHALAYYLKSGKSADYTCCLYATAPFLNAECLHRGFSSLTRDSNKNFAFSVTTFPFPIQRAIRLSNGGVEPLDRTMMAKRSQDLEECYHDAGQFYWGKTSAFLDDKEMFAAHSVPVIQPRYLVQDIDTLEDWKRAELMYKAYIASKEKGNDFA